MSFTVVGGSIIYENGIGGGGIRLHNFISTAGISRLR